MESCKRLVRGAFLAKDVIPTSAWLAKEMLAIVAIVSLGALSPPHTFGTPPRVEVFQEEGGVHKLCPPLELILRLACHRSDVFSQDAARICQQHHQAKTEDIHRKPRPAGSTDWCTCPWVRPLKFSPVSGLACQKGIDPQWSYTDVLMCAKCHVEGYRSQWPFAWWLEPREAIARRKWIRIPGLFLTQGAWRGKLALRDVWKEKVAKRRFNIALKNPYRAKLLRSSMVSLEMRCGKASL